MLPAREWQQKHSALTSQACEVIRLKTWQYTQLSKTPVTKLNELNKDIKRLTHFKPFLLSLKKKRKTPEKMGPEDELRSFSALKVFTFCSYSCLKSNAARWKDSKGKGIKIKATGTALCIQSRIALDSPLSRQRNVWQGKAGCLQYRNSSPRMTPARELCREFELALQCYITVQLLPRQPARRAGLT